jgi:hypothetical protein
VVERVVGGGNFNKTCLAQAQQALGCFLEKLFFDRQTFKNQTLIKNF